MNQRGKLALPQGAPLGQAVAAAMQTMVDRAEVMAGLASRQPGRAVHEFRKGLRRARALVRLTRGALPDRTRRSINRSLRNAQRAASPLRDADILPPLVRSLQRQAGLSADERRGLMLLAQLAAPLEGVRRAPAPAAVLRTQFGRVKTAAGRFQRALPAKLDWSDLEPGLASSFSRARKALRRLRPRVSDDSFHELRKAVKVLHYQAELLASTGHRPAEKLRKRLSDLAEAQGQVTDLMVLRAHLRAHRRKNGAAASQRDLQAVDALLARRIILCRTPTLKQGRRLLAGSPKKFARQLLPD